MNENKHRLMDITDCSEPVFRAGAKTCGAFSDSVFGLVIFSVLVTVSLGLKFTTQDNKGLKYGTQHTHETMLMVHCFISFSTMDILHHFTTCTLLRPCQQHPSEVIFNDTSMIYIYIIYI